MKYDLPRIGLILVGEERQESNCYENSLIEVGVVVGEEGQYGIMDVNVTEDVLRLGVEEGLSTQVLDAVVQFVQLVVYLECLFIVVELGALLHLFIVLHYSLYL